MEAIAEQWIDGAARLVHQGATRPLFQYRGLGGEPVVPVGYRPALRASNRTLRWGLDLWIWGWGPSRAPDLEI